MFIFVNFFLEVHTLISSDIPVCLHHEVEVCDTLRVDALSKKLLPVDFERVKMTLDTAKKSLFAGLPKTSDCSM
jgi:hypothetical protein